MYTNVVKNVSILSKEYALDCVGAMKEFHPSPERCWNLAYDTRVKRYRTLGDNYVAISTENGIKAETWTRRSRRNRPLQAKADQRRKWRRMSGGAGASVGQEA